MTRLIVNAIDYSVALITGLHPTNLVSLSESQFTELCLNGECVVFFQGIMGSRSGATEP